MSSLPWTGTKAITLHVLHSFLSVAWRVQVVGGRQEHLLVLLFTSCHEALIETPL